MDDQQPRCIYDGSSVLLDDIEKQFKLLTVDIKLRSEKFLHAASRLRVSGRQSLRGIPVVDEDLGRIGEPPAGEEAELAAEPARDVGVHAARRRQVPRHLPDRQAR